jgi:transposase
MANRRLTLREIKEILRLNESGISKTQIKSVTGVSRKTVREYINLAGLAGTKYGDIQNLSIKEIYAKLFPADQIKPAHTKKHPNWAEVHQELKKKHVTKALLWEEFIESNPDGCRYTQFCHHYAKYVGRLDLSMRQEHTYGEKCFIDYAGHTIPIIDQKTGEIQQSQIFVAVLGASNYTYAEATWTQNLADWTGSHCNAFEYFGGVPEITVPDNLKSGVNKACRYEPEVNRTYHDLAMHYGTAVIPTRVVHPKDKPKVEVGVQIVERWILARLRNRQFFSLEELNHAIKELLERLNKKKFKKLPGSREEAFLTYEKAMLKALPATKYEFAEWKKATVNIDYHIELDSHYYSVPYQQVREVVDVCYTRTTVSIYKNSQRIASHIRSYHKGKHTVIKEHMPKDHQAYLEWTPSRIISWAASIGQNTSMLVYRIIHEKEHPAIGYRSALGVIRLGKKYTNERLELAAARAIELGGFSYYSVKSILDKGLDKQTTNQLQLTPANIRHENIRGAEYFKEAAAC